MKLNSERPLYGCAFQKYLQNKQNDFRIWVAVIKPLLRTESPTWPNTKPEKSRAKYGKLANMPACAKLKPSTSLMNLGAAVIKKYNPHRLPKCNNASAMNGSDVIKLRTGSIA